MNADELKRRFGRKIQGLREARGLTQEQLAAKIGRSVDTLGNIERGVNATRVETADRLAVELGVRLTELFDLDDAVSAPVVELPPELEVVMKLLRDCDPATLIKMRDLIEVGLRLTRAT